MSNSADSRRPCLSVVIVLYNSAAELVGCIGSIRPAIESGWGEAIIVDNASPDDSATVARRELPQGHVLALAENLGFAAGVNAALPACSARDVLLLNPDVQVPDGALHELTVWMDAHREPAAASPELVDTDGVWGTPGRRCRRFGGWRSGPRGFTVCCLRALRAGSCVVPSGRAGTSWGSTGCRPPR